MAKVYLFEYFDLLFFTLTFFILIHLKVKTGNPEEPSTFVNAVIHKQSAEKTAGYIKAAKESPECEVRQEKDNTKVRKQTKEFL